MSIDQNKRLQLWSNGGGTQSTAMAALICTGKLPIPDIAVIVDTERESSAVWEYLDKYTMPALKAAGVTLHRVAKSQFATVDLYGAGDKLLIPAFTDESGDIGKLPTYCSTEWKKRVVRRFCNGIYPRDTKYNTWIGFTTDEPERVYQEPGKWHPVFPLINLRMTRGDCYRVVESMGWPEPPKSSCWMCPNRDHAAWMNMKKNHPADWAMAVEFERQIRLKDDAVYLHRSGVTLEEVQENDRQGDMFTGRCSGGYCYT